MLALLLRALMAKWGAEIVWEAVQELIRQQLPVTPYDRELVLELERTAIEVGERGRSRVTSPSDYDEDRDGYVWDEPCDPRD